MNRLLRRFVPVLLIAIALYGAFVVWSGYDDIRESLSAFRPIMLLWALGCATANYVLRLVKWEFYLWRLGIRGVGKLDSALVFLSGFAFTLTPGKVGEVFKSAVLLQ
ncbi:MAG: flippase-like domain-containing protein, partial [Myxococcaceae bacterium]|nr:flippase-like domain-containing protein [Myxococcaceae bacterium]